MERLTIPDVRVDEHTTRRTMIDGEAVREHAMDFYWRLKAYEDTGLTPEVFQSYVVFLQDLIGNQKASEALDRFRWLAEADKDGRVVVLPCKVGDTVYFRTYDCNGTVDLGIQPHKVTAIVWNAIVRGRYIDVGLPSGQYGVSWFLTREEAERALEAMKK